LGNVERAKAVYEETLALDRRIGRRTGVAACLGNLGSVYLYEGDYEAALRVLQEGLDLSRKLGHKRKEAGILNMLGSVYDHLGQDSRSKACYEDSLRIAQEIDAKNLECWYWVELGTRGLGHQTFPRGDPEECREYLDHAVTLARETEDVSLQFIVLLNEAMLLSSLNDYKAARQSLAHCLPLSQQHGCRFGPAYLAGLLAEGLCEEGNPKLAMQLLGAAEVADSHFRGDPGHFYMNPKRIETSIRDALGVQSAEVAFAEGQDMALDDLLSQLLVQE